MRLNRETGKYRKLPHGDANEQFGVLSLGMGGIQTKLLWQTIYNIKFSLAIQSRSLSYNSS